MADNNFAGKVTYLVTGKPGLHTVQFEAKVMLDRTGKKVGVKVGVMVSSSRGKWHAVKPSWKSSAVPSETWMKNVIEKKVKKLIPSNTFCVTVTFSG